MQPQHCFHIHGDELRPGILFYIFGQHLPPNIWFVGFDTDALDFGGEYVPGFRMYPGGEYHDRTPRWWETGGSKDPRPRRVQRSKKEVWALREGDWIGVADQRNGLQFLEVQAQTVHLRRPHPLEVSRYLHERAQRTLSSGNWKGLIWVRESLKAILEANQDAEIAQIHEEVKKMRPKAA